LAYLARKGSAYIFVSENVWTTVRRSPPVLRHLGRIGDPLFTDAYLHDHRLDLRPATFHRSWNSDYAAPPEGMGLLHSIQRGGRGRLCLSLRPGHLSTLVACPCGVACSRAVLGVSICCSSYFACFSY